MLTTAAGLSLVLTSCTADEPDTAAGEAVIETPGAEPSTSLDAESLRPVPAVGDPLPEEVFDDVMNTTFSGAGTGDYEFLYRTQDNTAEYYAGSGADHACLITVAVETNRAWEHCATTDTMVSGVSASEFGGNSPSTALSDTRPDADGEWVSPVDGFWIIEGENPE
jgi:hypothetical protein